MIKFETTNPPKITIRNITESEIMQVPGYIREYQKYIDFDTDLPTYEANDYTLIKLDKDLWIITNKVANYSSINDHVELCEFFDLDVDETDLDTLDMQDQLNKTLPKYFKTAY